KLSGKRTAVRSQLWKAGSSRGLPEGSNRRSAGKSLRARTEGARIFRHWRSLVVSPSSQREFMAEAQEDLKQTLFYARHVEAGGRIVPFGGYALPFQYPSGIMAEHKW